MAQQVPVDPSAIATAVEDGPSIEIANDIAYRRLGLAKVGFLGDPDGGDWALVDAGLPGTAEAIRAAAASRFGAQPPAAILLTHGHFDHVGALQALLEDWDVPVYAHVDEHPFLNGGHS